MFLLASPGVRHTVVFSLKHSPGSAKEEEFLSELKSLATLPMVDNFALTREPLNGKAPYAFALTMDMDDQDSYDEFKLSPEYLAFMKDQWEPAVLAFMENDFELPF